jgi:hypothetical protein
LAATTLLARMSHNVTYYVYFPSYCHSVLVVFQS